MRELYLTPEEATAVINAQKTNYFIYNIKGDREFITGHFYNESLIIDIQSDVINNYLYIRNDDSIDLCRNNVIMYVFDYIVYYIDQEATDSNAIKIFIKL